MNEKDTNSINISNFELPSQVDISSAVDFLEKLRASYTSNNINFNASKVVRMTTPGVQILLSAEATAKAKGGKITISEPSEAFKNIISDLGFSNQLKEWMGSNG